MNSVNSKNMRFIILFLVLLAIICAYSLLFNHDQDLIYTDVEQLELED